MFYKIRIHNLKKAHRFEELIKVFIPPENFIIVLDEKDDNASRTVGVTCEERYIRENLKDKVCENLEFSFENDNNALSREIYVALRKKTNKTSPWGIMTGIRPVRVLRNYYKSNLSLLEDKDKYFVSLKKSKEELQREYLVSDRKLDLIETVFSFQEKSFSHIDENSLGLYIGIPFCPTRCHYCSFTSNVPKKMQVTAYIKALIDEIKFCAENLKKTHFYIESIYFGGGTPSTLDKDEINLMLSVIRENFDLSKCKEITFEAGRADTITLDKLIALKENKVDRISVNPQTMNDKTLLSIGRNHNAKDFVEAFKMTRDAGFEIINCDLIAGLEGETFDDFKYSLKEIINLKPENITVHTLAMKRTSKLSKENKIDQYKNFETQKMLEHTYDVMKENDYFPYYMYRQKNMLGLGENVGFSKANKPSIYNYRVMEENQSILALGAGGISKLYFPREDRIERVPNVSDLKTYIEKISNMQERKLKNFFKEAENVSKST